ncbi:MAG TPA: carboxypeptidase regulatory-like domain-containing protein [Gemmatimonadales bacterium]|nr:carboxypeptidase regulatory-like domain-containing protein [Gemmatimonadales bacterium]
MRILLAVLLGCGLAAPASGQPPPQGTGMLRGQVTDSLGIPVPFAEVAILSTDLRAVADSDGLFRIRNVPAGLFAVIVRAIGWKSYLFLIRMEPGMEQIGRIGLEPAPQHLPDLEVTAGKYAKPAEYALTHRYDDFFHRRRVRSGIFRLRSDPAFTSAVYTGDLLRMIPGVRVSFGGGGTAVSFSRCTGPNDKVAVWIDGARTMTDNHNEALGYLRASDIEMIEVYRGPGQIPAEFLADSCAAIVIWTR